MPQHTVDLIANRSGTRALHLDVRSPYVSNDTISRYCHRWKEIMLGGLTVSELQDFQRLTPSSDLTSLRSLRLIGSVSSPSSYAFSSDWRPATLENLHCTLSIPAGLSASTLTNCCFEFSDFIDFNGLANFLSFAPRLIQLKITIGEIDAIDREDDVRIELPSLQNFMFCSYGASEDAVLVVLQATSFPNVTVLSISFEAGCDVDDYNISSCFATILENVGKFRHLEGLNLKVVCGDDGEDDYDSFCLDKVFAQLPESIKSLSIAACDMKLCPPCDVSLDTLEELRSVRFDNCKRLNVDFFEDLAECFKVDEILLTVMQIRGCREIDSDELIDEEAVKMLFRDYGVLQA